jgi:hypothetical protein
VLRRQLVVSHTRARTRASKFGMVRYWNLASHKILTFVFTCAGRPIPLWEMEFCSYVGNISWHSFCKNKKYVCILNNLENWMIQEPLRLFRMQSHPAGRIILANGKMKWHPITMPARMIIPSHKHTHTQTHTHTHTNCFAWPWYVYWWGRPPLH